MRELSEMLNMPMPIAFTPKSSVGETAFLSGFGFALYGVQNEAGMSYQTRGALTRKLKTKLGQLTRRTSRPTGVYLTWMIGIYDWIDACCKLKVPIVVISPPIDTETVFSGIDRIKAQSPETTIIVYTKDWLDFGRLQEAGVKTIIFNVSPDSLAKILPDLRDNFSGFETLCLTAPDECIMAGIAAFGANGFLFDESIIDMLDEDDDPISKLEKGMQGVYHMLCDGKHTKIGCY
ncbi:MAG: hypothetical protein UT66_C0035G0025 [candidate division CPR2 bacterium GW2011_GWC1_39_9]|uniref:Uncharacterized protein n=1 Tax=candidate division CPR2 bacterium GW2011_GWC2_39_10 TaxID=1618345 RepID=A0A0G0PWJ2_UNCC2|nr:MAG: hypothetical protein UT18_C0016G0002 [candidate division CPR2 bacterium GW2011_GWC2_39_10]KKR33692.1 MAG: hypothetical protein UT66_C0035G0025 [candidate division CPR2 bacterium GW2011_GWC1_39_9]